MANDKEELTINTSVCLHVDEVPQKELKIPELPPGLMVRPLRYLEAGTLRAGVISIPDGWISSKYLRCKTTQQMFVLSGEITLGNLTFGRNSFFVCPAGASLQPIKCERKTEAIVIFDDAQSYESTDSDDEGVKAHFFEDVFALEPFIPVIEGRRLSGFERRVLWLDETTGADTRLLKVAGGFEGKGPSWHGVNEEIFCLTGDIAPDDTRPMVSGSYLWNPAKSVHGFHEHSREGCTLLEWHDGPWDYNLYQA